MSSSSSLTHVEQLEAVQIELNPLLVDVHRMYRERTVMRLGERDDLAVINEDVAFSYRMKNNRSDILVIMKRSDFNNWYKRYLEKFQDQLASTSTELHCTSWSFLSKHLRTYLCEENVTFIHGTLNPFSFVIGLRYTKDYAEREITLNTASNERYGNYQRCVLLTIVVQQDDNVTKQDLYDFAKQVTPHIDSLHYRVTEPHRILMFIPFGDVHAITQIIQDQETRLNITVHGCYACHTRDDAMNEHHEVFHNAQFVEDYMHCGDWFVVYDTAGVHQTRFFVCTSHPQDRSHVTIPCVLPSYTDYETYVAASGSSSVWNFKEVTK